MPLPCVSFELPGHVPFGEVQGFAPGNIPAYSNKHDHFFSGERNLDHNLFCGFKYQCVEFARRWLYLRKGLILPAVNWACHIFKLREVLHASTALPVQVTSIRNGTADKPVPDALIVYPSSDANVVGHVSVITEVGEDYVCVADQNYRFHKWEHNYAYKLKLQHENGVWTLVDDIDPDDIECPLGWVTFPGHPNLPEDGVPVPVHTSLAFKAPKMYFNRITFQPEESKPNWLDMNDPAEKLFIQEFGMDVSRSRLEESEASYYEVNQELHYHCIATGSQLHQIFMEATAEVIADDEKLRTFAIPEEFWPRLRHSWKHQQTYLTGRFDFVFNAEKNLFKCFEYNADSASTLLECGRIQEKWAASIGLDKGNTRPSGFSIERNLRAAWSKCGATGRVHFCVDKDLEEQYTALYCMQAAEAVGLEGKLCVMFDEFKFNEKGQVVDSDGVVVTSVWKTWMWESAITDYYKAKAERGPNWKPSPSEEVRLCDLLLGENWDVMVFEPMWKLIPSNKAILPIIYRMHPDHPAILKADFTLTDELIKCGYVKKPIVGRVGSNITITESNGKVREASVGAFGERDMIYQELFPMTKQDDYYAILGGWMIGDTYSGTGIREDRSIITGLDSPFSAMRIRMDVMPKPVTHADLNKMADDE